MIRNKVETRKNIARISDKVGAYTVEDLVPKVKLRKNVGFFWGEGGVNMKRPITPLVEQKWVGFPGLHNEATSRSIKYWTRAAGNGNFPK